MNLSKLVMHMNIRDDYRRLVSCAYVPLPLLLSDIKSMTSTALKFLTKGSTLPNCHVRDGAELLIQLNVNKYWTC